MENARVTVECGLLSVDSSRDPFETTKQGNKVLVSQAKFQEKFEVVSFGSGKNSMSLTLNKESNLPTVEIASINFFNTIFESVDGEKFSLKAGVICKSAGYGVGPNGYAGLLRSGIQTDMIFTDRQIGDLIPKKYDYVSGCKIANLTDEFESGKLPIGKLMPALDKIGIQETILAPGDSGGPLLCSADNGKTFFLVATAQTVGPAVREVSGEKYFNSGERWSPIYK